MKNPRAQKAANCPRFICPYCMTAQDKGPDVIHMTLYQAGSFKIVGEGFTGNPERDLKETVYCRLCRQPINFRQLLSGDFDYCYHGLNIGVVAGLVVVGLMRWVVEFGWSLSVLLGVTVGVALGVVGDKWERHRIRHRTAKE